MKVLINIARKDGSYLDCGMIDNQTCEIVRFVRTVKSIRGAERIAKRRANGRKYTLEIMR